MIHPKWQSAFSSTPEPWVQSQHDINKRWLLVHKIPALARWRQEDQDCKVTGQPV